jgi:hypothetical protein
VASAFVSVSGIGFVGSVLRLARGTCSAAGGLDYIASESVGAIFRKHAMGIHVISLTVFVACLATTAASPLAFRQNMIVSIKGFGFCRAIWPRADMS